MNNHDPVRFGSELVSVSTGEWLRHDEVTRPLVVFVHGFTAHGKYLWKHARRVPQAEYCAAVFNYDSYVGIDNAAKELASLLAGYKTVFDHGIVFVAHSMGGLVTRFCVRNCLDALAICVKGVVLLGTPNDGTLNNGWMLARILDVGDRLTKINPYFRLRTCRAAKQLTLCDEDNLIRNLNTEERGITATFSTLTIAGGQNYLEVGSPLFVDWLSNMMIQRALKRTQNDGLVPEASVNLGGVLKVGYGYTHRTGYTGYPTINHSALAGNQLVSDQILDFLKRVAPSGPQP
jgi:pimeloyl-ACP methyl ester carboxylesterase